MNYSRLFRLTIKKYLNKPFFLFILLLIPVLSVLLSNTKEDNSPQILVGFYLDGDSVDFNNFREELEQGNSLFLFQFYDSEESLLKDVSTGRLECGYLVPKDLFDKMMDGQKRDLITLITSPKTTMAPIINEAFYAPLFQILSEKLLTRYLTEDSAITTYYSESFTATDIHTLYQHYLTDGSTFSFQYQGAPKEYEITTKELLLSPVRGILSILIILSGFVGTLSYYQNQNNPIYHNKKVRIIQIGVPSLITMLCCYISILFSNYHDNWLKELFLLFLYSISSILFLFFLSLIIKKREIFSSILPAFLLACMIFSPIFIDVTSLIPALKPISYLFLPTYYLAFF